jgi:hypothetical protein
MAYFAVVKDRDNKAFDVPICHLNLWVLPSLVGHCFQFDVGIQIRANENGLTGFLLALPFTVAKDGMEDLHDLLLSKETAQLIFGEPVVVKGETISYGMVKDLKVGRIFAQKSSEIPVWSSQAKHCSVWKIDLVSVLNCGEEEYVRLRFHIAGLGRRWMCKRSLLADNGAVMDFRVSDIREAQEAMDWAGLQDRIVGIGTLYAFVITPVSLQLRSVSPDLKYVRLLEGDAWEPYIRRKTGIIRSHQLLIFYWKAKDVSIEKPFRGFLDLSREFGVSSWANHFRTGIVAVLSFIAALYLREGYSAVDSHVIRAWLFKVGYPVSGITVFSAMLWIFRHTKPALKLYTVTRQATRAIDKWLYRRN